MVSAQDDEFGIGDTVRLEVTGKVVDIGPSLVGIVRSDGVAQQFTNGPDSLLTLMVVEKAYTDGGIYIDSDGELLKWIAATPSHEGYWTMWSKYYDQWDSEPLAKSYASLPVHRLDGE